MSVTANIARHLPQMAARQPGQPALKIPRGRTAGRIDYLTLSFRELDDEVNAWAVRLADGGVGRGDRVLVLARPGLPLIAAAFALFHLGAVPVVIDPGMGRRAFLACVARAQPRVLLGPLSALWLSRGFRTAFATVAVRLRLRGTPTARLGPAGRRLPLADTAATELAAVLFTSGSTGVPKGVAYEHGMFDAQVRLLRAAYGIQPGEVDLTLLPIFALFNPALGVTTIVPEIDPARPAAVDPDKILQALRQEQVTTAFGSPTLWGKLTARARERGLTLPALRRALLAGAPVPPALFAALQPLLPHGTAHSPYGATEALPLCSISAPEVLAGTAAATAAGAGTCVGRPVAEITVAIVAVTDGPLATFAEAHRLPAGAVGEIVVRGPVVTRAYDRLSEATARAKIADPAAGPEVFWHRMGDAGYLDAEGRLWFCGRLAERVVTAEGPLDTGQVEPIFNAHPAVRRTALIGLGAPGAQEPALVVEPLDPATLAAPAARAQLVRELRRLGATQPQTARLRRFFLHPRFPVDVRHNAKIHRLALARWASGQTPLEAPEP